jgi:hypothetical protein
MYSKALIMSLMVGVGAACGMLHSHGISSDTAVPPQMAQFLKAEKDMEAIDFIPYLAILHYNRKSFVMMTTISTCFYF